MSVTAMHKPRIRHRIKPQGRVMHCAHSFMEVATAKDEGSGTMAGVALIALVAILALVAASAGQLLIKQRQARTAADLSALSAAVQMRAFDNSPCDVAREIGKANGASVVHCFIEDEDSIVETAVPVSLPFIDEVRRTSRAGPVQCGAEVGGSAHSVGTMASQCVKSP